MTNSLSGYEADEWDVDRKPGTLVYSSFWSRLLANLIDTLVFAPLVALEFWALSSRSASLALVIPLGASGPLYSVIMHARRGQTIGKIVARIQVRKVSGQPVSWREAICRDSVGIVLVVTSTAATMFALLQIPDSAWGSGWLQVAAKLVDAEPSWGRWAGAAAQVWFWGELFVLLLNRKRRALHDFIAGTVVVRRDENSTGHI